MSKEEKLLRAFLIVIVALVIGTIALLINSGGWNKDTEGFEFIKLLAQFLFVGVIGVIISVLVQNYYRERERNILINGFRKDILNDLIRTYSDIKKARRIIRASRLDNDKLVYKNYDEQLRAVIDAQLALEIIYSKVEMFPVYFGKNEKTAIRDNITKMEKYLSNLIKEYEKSLLALGNEPDVLPLASLPVLNGVLQRTKDNESIRQQFFDPYSAAVKEIRSQIFS